MESKQARRMAKLPSYYKARHPHQPGVFFMPQDTTENIDSALRYQAKSGNLFLCNYPKCGITWLQNIVWRITHKGQPFTKHIRKHIALLEFDGSEGVASTREESRYQIIKTHFPFKWVPKHPKAKYIFIAREPKDVCVSLYYHIKGFSGYDWAEGLFDDLVEGFLKGEVDGGDYFDMLNEWHTLRNEPSILFLLYEDLVSATKETIMKVAEFLGEEYVNDLSPNNHELLDNIVQETSLAKMKEKDTNWYYTERSIPFIRKGIIGDWRNHMSASQAAAFDERLREASRGSGSDKLWLKWKDI